MSETPIEVVDADMRALDEARSRYDTAVFPEEADIHFVALCGLILSQFTERVKQSLLGYYTTRLERIKADAASTIETYRARITVLEQWRDDVTVALQNPGGARFDEVPKLVSRLRFNFNALADAVAGPDRESVEDRDIWTIEALVTEAENLRNNGPDVPVVRLHDLIDMWRARQENIQSDYWRDQGVVSVLESAITDLETVIARVRALEQIGEL